VATRGRERSLLKTRSIAVGLTESFVRVSLALGNNVDVELAVNESLVDGYTPATTCEKLKTICMVICNERELLVQRREPK
jgi:hypothetical protein